VPRRGVRAIARFVLVHGAYRGAWSWDRLAPLLRSAGHDVVAPTLAGQGERAAELRPGIGLRSHVDEVAALIGGGGEPAVLVGHSYGGMVVSGAAHAAPRSVRTLVYLDAPVPSDGQALWDLFSAERREQLLSLARAEGDGWLLPPRDALDAVRDPGLREWIAARLTPQPLASFTEAVTMRSAQAASLPRAYVRFRGGQRVVSPVSLSAGRVRGDPAWRYAELDEPHDAMVTAPADLARILGSIIT
jgi:pimeloyl-ACP methyl ester carboxylesterase